MTDLYAYDSAVPALIPRSATAVLPYGDGRNKWSHILFPKAAYRYFTVTGDPDIDIADFEPGCIWPGSALRHWAERRRELHPGYDLTVYTDRNNYAEAAAALTGYEWHLFIATLDNSILTEFDGKPCRACQYTDRSGAYDISKVFDADWLIQP